MNAPLKTSTALTDVTLVEAADMVARGETTSVALTAAAIEAFKSKDAKVNALIWMDEQNALETAEALDRMRKAGRITGPLHGVPLAHKDMYYQAGKPCTCGSAIRKDFRPAYTATVIDRLHGAGSITLGGLNMAEFAQNPSGHNRHFGHCHNPWSLDYCTGGSSSGSGAAVAARFVSGALGSDTGGSIRLPASICGVTGIKGTQTRVSRYGVMPLSFSADNVGPLARTARDCARILSVIAGADPMDPTAATEPVPDYESLLDGDVRGLRIGVPTNYFFDNVDPEVGAAFEAAMAVLQARGAEIVPVTIPHMDAVVAYGSIVSRCEGATIHAQWMRERPDDYAVHLNARLYGSYSIPAVYYVEALARRGAILKAVASDVFGACDVFATPTLRYKVPTLLETDIDAGTEGAIEKFNAISINTRPINYLGLPSVSVPCGFDSNGVPIGFQIQGRPFAEGRVLKVADAYQRDTDWHTRKPAV
ncbi:amidase [Prosthecomicrobium hirschii]|uniref:amidase n=1 Tax=Prosthecodimorpha hirschii TaxID=665126 RepID=UPI00221F292D|nr:amidase [Prosthecomicrobium hirschii]MCW1842656.1 amidase family protein [Prosthecomicrobium hirschii]